MINDEGPVERGVGDSCGPLRTEIRKRDSLKDLLYKRSYDLEVKVQHLDDVRRVVHYENDRWSQGSSRRRTFEGVTNYGPR